MAIVEVNNIENYGGPSGWEWKSLLAVLFGYLLKLATDEILKYKEKKKVKEIFEFELKSFKDPLKKQLADVRNYKDKITAFEYSTISIYFKHKFEMIKTLDKVTLVKAYRKSRKKEAAQYISSIYNNIDLLYTELMQYEEFYREHIKHSDNFLLEYKTNLDNIRRAIALYCDTLDQVQYDQDILLKTYTEIDAKFVHGKTLDLKLIVSLIDTFHLELFNKLPTEAHHPLYITINEFNFKGKDLIQLFKVKTERHVAYIKRVEDSIEEKYSSIYSETIDK